MSNPSRRLMAALLLASLAALTSRPAAPQAPPAPPAGPTLAPVSARSFFADRRASLPGDTLTVVITENSSVSASAQTQTNKAESSSGTLSHAGITRNLAVGIDSKGGGGGLIERTGKVVANLAVTVTAVDSRGNLLIHGEQGILVNNERQRIALDGYVRAEDIGPDNTIPSARVAGARIEFTGKGLLARQQSPGLLNRILSFFWE